MIKIYTDTGLLTEENRRIVFPLLFDVYYLNNPLFSQKYELVSSIDACDIVILPLDVDYFYKKNKVVWMDHFIEVALEQKKKVWVYSANDFGMTIHKDVYTFRLGGLDSKLNDKTFILPSFIDDPYIKLKQEYKSLSKPEVPVIGFVGNANGSKLRWIKEFLLYLFLNAKLFLRIDYYDYQPFYPSSTKRFHFLNALKKSDKIKTDFIFRKKYRAGVKTEEEKEMTTRIFLVNVYQNPYTFCVRGAGNFSVRFYETLAMGRIPLIIDTDIRLPLGSMINWKDHCVMANKNNFIQALIDFHKNCTEADFEKMQDNNRRLWIDCLNRNAYFLSIHSIFNNLR